MSSAWRRTVWQGERAWASESVGWRAIVSENRARLVFLGSDENLLATPQGPILPGHPPPLGGHVLWLGPQTLWQWPPIEDWACLEFEAVVSGGGARLTLQHPWRDRRFGALTRSYHWDGAELVCSAFWAGEMPVHAVHIVQVPRDVVILAPPGSGFVRGYARFKGESLDPEPPIDDGIAMVGGSLQFRYTGVSAKFALPPKTLRVERGTSALELRPCRQHAAWQQLPDFGLVTQIWRGSDELPFMEIEQLSAIHRVSDGAESSVRLVPLRI